VSFELARRLVKSGAVEPRDVETALLSSVARRVGFVQALIDLGPNVGRAVLRELGNLSLPAVHTVRIDAMLVRRLPSGLCERLLAVPLATDASGSVTVGAVDPLDAHVEHEFSFQLGAKVRVVRAAYADLVTALEVLQGGLGRTEPLPALRNEPLDVDGGPPSVPPIPLVRRQPARTGSTAAAPRAKQPLEVSRSSILAATTPTELIAALEAGLAAEARKVLILAVKEGVFEGIAGHAGDLKAVRGSTQEPSVLSSALAAGYYLGRLKQASLDRAIEAGLELAPGQELYAIPVFVSGRAALMVVAAGLEGTLETTRRIDDLARDAGTQLEQIVRSRKRSR
jgi:hypothetical protein